MTLRRSSEARSSGSSRTELENDAANTRIDHAAPGASAALSDNDDVSVKRPSDAGASLLSGAADAWSSHVASIDF